MNFELAASVPDAVPRFEYERLLPALARPLPPDVLAAIVFGRAMPVETAPSESPDPRLIHVGLEPLGPHDLVELWAEPVQRREMATPLFVPVSAIVSFVEHR